MKSFAAACFSLIVVVGCSGDDLKSEGAACFGSAECAEGLTCDFGQSPAVCALGQTGTPVDAAGNDEADAQAIDAMPGSPDARVIPLPDAQPGTPDAALPDAALPDAALPDAALPDAAVDAASV